MSNINFRYIIFALIFCVSILSVWLTMQTYDQIAQFPSEANNTSIQGRTLIEVERILNDGDQIERYGRQLLNIAELMGGAILLITGLLIVHYVAQTEAANTKLIETADESNQEMNTLREKFDQSSYAFETEFMTIRDYFRASAEKERLNTSNSILAYGLIPIAERQYRAVDYTGAITTYKHALSLDPENPIVNYHLGYVHTQTGDLEDAQKFYESAIAQVEDFAPALAGWGYVFRRKAERINVLISSDGSEEKSIPLIFERDKLFNQAERLLLHALNLSPKLVNDDGESWWGALAYLYERRGQLEHAQEAYKKVTEITPESSYGYRYLALLAIKQGNYEHAREIFSLAEKIAANEAEAFVGNFEGYADWIVSSFALGNIELAERNLPIMISITPEESPYVLPDLVASLETVLPIVDEQHHVVVQRTITQIKAEIDRRSTLNANHNSESPS